jgi:hypothetical protein
MSKNKKEKLLESLFGGDMSPDLSSHHVQESGDGMSERGNFVSKNWQQTDNKVATEPTTVLATKRQQTDNKVATKKSVNLETDNKVATEPTTVLATKRQQTDNKVATNPCFYELVGLQRSIVVFLYENCKISLGRTTTPIALENISVSLKTSSGSVKTTLQRLESKKIINRIEFKNGRGGWSRYELSESIYRDLLQHDTGNKLATKWQQTDNKVGTELATEPTTKLPYSSSNDLYNKETTNIAAEVLIIPENLKRFGVSSVNLQNLITAEKTTLEIVQRSLSALSFDVENGKTGNLANILFGVLGSGREYISQKYSETLQAELDLELARIAKTEENQKRSAELQLSAKFKEYVSNNPEFLETVRSKHKGFVASSELLEKVAFEEFKAIQTTL